MHCKLHLILQRSAAHLTSGGQLGCVISLLYKKRYELEIYDIHLSLRTLIQSHIGPTILDYLHFSHSKVSLNFYDPQFASRSRANVFYGQIVPTCATRVQCSS